VDDLPVQLQRQPRGVRAPSDCAVGADRLGGGGAGVGRAAHDGGRADQHVAVNVDDPAGFRRLLDAVNRGVRGLPVVFPVHPRTAKTLQSLEGGWSSLRPVDPLGYLEFNHLVRHAKGVITDSGGVTEETTVMGVPCLTLRDTTERPETVTMGTNELIGTDPAALQPALDRLFEGQWKKGSIPDLWDGRTSVRIVEALERLLCA
jgi:UDP-N-acetylglucosamine 2-epimerase (non-hydrolysing)